jgi:hypothetical protein
VLSAAPERFSAFRPPSSGCAKQRCKTRAQTCAAGKREWLFDIVRRELPKTVRRRAASSAVLNPEERACASASAKSSERARVSKDEDGGPSCFETHRSGLGPWKRLRSGSAAMPLSMRARGAAFWQNEPNKHFGQTKPSGEHARERRTNPRLCEMTAGAISLFRVVIYNEVCNPHVPAALSAQDLARQHARTRAAGASSIYLARRFAVVSTGLCWCVCCAAKQTRGGRIQRCSSCDSRARSIRAHGFL